MFTPRVRNSVYREENVSLYFGDVDQGKGTLNINENILEWKNNNKHLKFQYTSISLHAISRETSKFPHECIYCLIETESEEAIISEEDNDQVDVSEVRFVPDKKESIQAMYDAITTCQELHPDPNEEFSDDEEQLANEEEGDHLYEELDPNVQFNLDGFYTSNTNIDDIQMSEEGLEILQRLQQNMIISSNGETSINNGNAEDFPGNQFADAEE